MISDLSKPEVQEFLRLHGQDDPARVALMKNLPAEISPALLASQLKARQKAKDKLPSWYARDGIIFPHGVALEQCSSEETALFKAREMKGRNFLDLTGGTGVDSWAFSQVFEKGVLVEQDEERSQLAKHNLDLLGASNLAVVRSTAEEFLRLNTDTYDLIYLDPDRRTTEKRAIGLTDSAPDVVQLMPELTRQGRLVLVKASPMLDVHLAVKQLRTVSQVNVLAVNNEVKEVLFFCIATPPAVVPITAINLGKDSEDFFSFVPKDEKDAFVFFSEPVKYLYEPNAAILKAGAFRMVASRFGLEKLHQNTHLYTSNNLISEFPGRVFHILDRIPFSGRLQKTSPFQFTEAHVAIRNFPIGARELQKKLNLQEGGEIFVFGATIVSDKKVLIVADRVK